MIHAVKNNDLQRATVFPVSSASLKELSLSVPSRNTHEWKKPKSLSPSGDVICEFCSLPADQAGLM